MNTLFDNTQIAFASKTDADLKKTYILFKLMSSSFLTKIGTRFILFCLKIGAPIKGLIHKTMFNYFCVGTTLEEAKTAVLKLRKSNISSVLNYSVEGVNSELGFNQCLTEILRTMDASSSEEGIPFAVFKPTGYGDITLFEKVSAKKKLTHEEKQAWNNVKERFHKSCQKAAEQNLKILIDAEESWIQPALDSLLEEMMVTYNKTEIVVFATIQMYLSERFPYLISLIEKSKKEKFQIGVKLVRGAYIKKETLRANQLKLPNPVCPSKEITDNNFDKGVELLFKNLNHAAVFIGSHNEASTLKAISLMKQMNIPKNHPHVFFSHLFGMSDNMSYNLSNSGYNVIKYLPFGPLKKVIPYLIRRADENSSVANQTSRELELIRTEIKRRKIKKQK